MEVPDGVSTRKEDSNKSNDDILLELIKDEDELNENASKIIFLLVLPILRIFPRN